jgi:hypothetical protein
VGSAVYSAVDSEVHSAVGSAVDSEVRSAVDSEVRSAVASAVHSAVYSAVDSAVRSAVGSAVGSEVGSEVRSAVASAVHSAVRSEVGLAVDSAVDSEVSSAVYSAVVSAVHSAVYSAVGSDSPKLFWHYWIGGSVWAWWPAFVAYFRDICLVPFDKKILARALAYETTTRSCGYWWPNKDFVMISERPCAIRLDERGRLHADRSMTIEYRDGWGLYQLHGVPMTREHVMANPTDLDPRAILTEANVDVRRELIRKVGMDRMIAVLEPKVLDTRGDYALLSVRLTEELADCRFLKMLNPSLPDTWHVEGVDPKCATVEQAINWRAGDMAKPWTPAILT